MQCIVPDQYAVNILSETSGFNRDHVSVKDFVWVYSVGPTARARAAPCEVLEGAHRMRSTAFYVTIPLYFRATEYTFVTPPKDKRATLGIILKVRRRGHDSDHVNNIRVTLKGYHEAVTVSSKPCDFPTATAGPDQRLFGDMRHNSSTASRISAAPASKAAQSYLVNAIRIAVPAFSYETLTPSASTAYRKLRKIGSGIVEGSSVTTEGGSASHGQALQLFLCSIVVYEPSQRR
ncbi:unnamed protein product [Nippostrongylus brasiliensis]|uniref:Uncharacterized protein n=1 Tax=Nippostrongylus brasiliensis TaxID=27835 RepID=A0A0N4YTB6_NIPBR|nr:unnamed protein product [Nippostrongylus brasiliensis]